MDKEETIKKAIDDFSFFNEGEYITREMAESKDTVLNYIEKIENIYKKEYNEHMEMKRQNGVLRNNERILKEKIEELEKERKNFYDGEIYTCKQLKNIEKNQRKYFINKCVIRDKIEELETKKKKYGFGSIESIIFLNKVQVLNELLKEEKCQF